MANSTGTAVSRVRIGDAAPVPTFWGGPVAWTLH